MRRRADGPWRGHGASGYDRPDFSAQRRHGLKKRRLHLQIFRALVATGVASLCFTALVTWLFRSEEQRMPRFVQDVGAFILADMPERDAAAFQRELEERAARLHASLTVWNPRGEQVARVGRVLGPAKLEKYEPELLQHEQMRIRLDDGRVLALSFDDQASSYRAAFFLCSVGLLLGTLMLGSYLAARRITRRLERLEHGVTQFGEGSLDVRMQVRGRDEIASLAQAFNRSFDRIAGLLKQQRNMLQSASHELRSPLARLRMAMELATEETLDASARERLRTDASRDIEELDALIGDLLLAGRLADTELPKDFARVDVGPIVESEAVRVSAQHHTEADELSVQGNPRMLRSLVRNLLENARRHGKDPIRASLSRAESHLVLRVEDAGSGVPEADRERIFEPFYRPAGHREGKDGGVGLGLSLVKNIAEHHGGSVRYCPGAGSCFEVHLPTGGARPPSDPALAGRDSGPNFTGRSARRGSR
jgi:two-component system OmpR family sensor kinase